MMQPLSRWLLATAGVPASEEEIKLVTSQYVRLKGDDRRPLRR
jgi:hypothetical protein